MEPRQKCLLSAALLSDPLRGAAADGSILREEEERRRRMFDCWCGGNKQAGEARDGAGGDRRLISIFPNSTLLRPAGRRGDICPRVLTDGPRRLRAPGSLCLHPRRRCLGRSSPDHLHTPQLQHRDGRGGSGLILVHI